MHHIKRNFHLSAHFLHIGLIRRRGLPADAVVDMDRPDRQIVLLPQLQKHTKQAYGVCSSRYACYNHITLIQHPMCAHIVSYLFIHVLFLLPGWQASSLSTKYIIL
jgi:hypothetical protein